MEDLLDLADALAKEAKPKPDFPLSEELERLSRRTQDLLVRKDSPNKGRGWFARQDIPAGTVLIVAKPLAMVMDWEDDAATEETDDNSDHDGDEEEEDSDDEPRLNSMIVLQLLRELKQKPELWTNALADLYPRNERDLARLPTLRCKHDNMATQMKTLFEELKGHPQLKDLASDICKRLSLIVRYNVLSVETCSELLSHPGPDGHANLGGVGLYYLPSFFNHSSTPNVIRWAVGDVMWFVSNQTVRAGHEACISYIEHDVLCESAYRRNLMLQMDFEDVGENNNVSSLEEEGPDLPVVDSEVQNELMEMDSFERLTAIEELLLQAHGMPPANRETTGDQEGPMETSESGWFQCDIQNLRILKAITLDGLGQTAEALSVWEECVTFTESALPPLDENSIVVRVQTALCSLHLGDKDHIARAQEHARKALQTHDMLFGGGPTRFRRRYHSDFKLALRSAGNQKGISGAAAIDFLWPLTTE